MGKLVAAAILLVIGLWGTIMVPPGPIVPIRLWPGGPDLTVPAYVMPLLGVACTWAALRLFHAIRPSSGFTFGRETQTEEAAPDSALPLVGVAVVALAVLALVAVDKGKLGPAPAALLLVCGTLTMIVALQAVAALRDGDEIGLSSQWGGLGGGLGGWKISPVTTLLLIMLVFLGIAVAIGGGSGGGGGNLMDGTDKTGSNAVNGAKAG